MAITVLKRIFYDMREPLFPFEIYDDFLIQGDGDYRISLFVQGEDGSWNDNHLYLPSGAAAYVTADGRNYLCMRG